MSHDPPQAQLHVLADYLEGLGWSSSWAAEVREGTGGWPADCPMQHRLDDAWCGWSYPPHTPCAPAPDETLRRLMDAAGCAPEHAPWNKRPPFWDLNESIRQTSAAVQVRR